MLIKMIEVVWVFGVVIDKSLKWIVVDMIVMEKNIVYLMDVWFYECVWVLMVGLVKEVGIELC